MRTIPRIHLTSLGLLVGTVTLATACRTTPPVPEPSPVEPQYTTTATVKDIMLAVVDPNADVVWQAVSFVQSDKGLIETKPTSEQDWVNARRGALTLAEATNLLMVPGRHVAGQGEKSETPGIELEPAEMEVLINKDRTSWNKHAGDLHTAVQEALAAIDAKDAEKLFEVGEHIERACESCHQVYWYPNEKIPDFTAAQQ